MIYLGLLLFFVFEYVRPTTFFPWLEALRLNTIIPVGTGVLNAFSSGRVKNSDFWGDINGGLLALLLAMLTFSFVLADVHTWALDVLKAVAGYSLVAWVLVRQVTSLRRLRLVFLTLMSVHVLLALSTPQMFAEADSRVYIASGTFLSDGNDFALSVTILLPFCMYLLLESTNFRQRGLYVALLIFLVACVVLTKSRGGTIALGCVGLYYWLKTDRKVLIGFLLTVVVMGILLYAPGVYFERMGTINTQEESAQGRIDAWKAAVRMATDRPFGVGAGHFPHRYADYRVEDIGRHRITAHSIYFLILGELGFVGLAWLIGFLATNLSANRRLAQQLKDSPLAAGATAPRLLWSMNASVIAFAVGGAFLSQVYTPHLYVLAGLMTASRRLIRERHGLLASDERRESLPHVAPAASLRHRHLRGRTALTPERGR